MQAQALSIRRSSASVLGSLSTLRKAAVVSKYIDTTTCIGCKACEVACQEWNDLRPVETEQTGTYQTLPTLHAQYWNLIRFNERDFEGGLLWLMRKDQCMHCDEPGCLAACPAPGAIVQYENGIVDVNPDQCIGCGYCETGCPFDVPRFSKTTGKMSKCTLCVDRVGVGLEPACIKACPTGCLQFGTKQDMLELARTRVGQLQSDGFAQATVYDPAGVNGTSVITVLAHGDHPEWYGLPSNPRVPILVTLWKKVLRPLGAVAIFGAIIGAFAHYTKYGPKKVAGAEDEDANLPGASASASEGPRGETAMSSAAHPPARPVDPAVLVAQRQEDVVVGHEIVRHNRASRLIHWSVAVTFAVCLLTGMPIWTPVFGWMAHLFGGLSVCRVIHPWAGVAFFLASAAMFFQWVSDMRLDPGDRQWLGPRTLQYMRYETDDSRTGKYNGGQKLYFWATALGAVGLMVSGLPMWFPETFPPLLMQLSYLLHDFTFVCFAVALVFHIYLATAAEPGTFGSMTRGTVTKAWARLHHGGWYRDVTREEPRSR